MGKESGFNPLSPVNDVGKEIKKVVSGQLATSALETTSKLLKITGKKTAINLASGLDKLAKVKSIR